MNSLCLKPPFILLAVVLLSSCAHSPRTFNDTEMIRQVRMDYIRTYPDGQYNGHIVKGEVVKGMNLMEVLASWGLPNTRKSSESGAYEYWTYYSVDQESGDVRRYKLIFKEQIVVDWQVAYDIAGNGGFYTENRRHPSGLDENAPASDVEKLKKK